ncbi:MAG: peptidoglycan-binding protein [Candidatus Kapabacteria bacterium]|nr:peptidoglycan-binding protein [Candidatus Kapabacteria bacterium]
MAFTLTNDSELDMYFLNDDHTDRFHSEGSGNGTGFDSLFEKAKEAGADYINNQVNNLLNSLLQNGSSSNEVYTLQQLLCVNGFPVVSDGKFGTKTENALKAFQSSKGISPSGKTDAITWEALNNGWDRTKYSELNNSVCASPGNNNSNGNSGNSSSNQNIVTTKNESSLPWWGWALGGFGVVAVITGIILYFYFRKKK